MRPFLRLLLSLLLLGLAPVGAMAQSSGIQRTDRIEAELVAMHRSAAPGSTAVVAVRQKIQPGWHTYWRNPGDSGGPTTLTWSLPQGLSAGEIVWPLPDRQRLQSLVNYGYEDAVYLPVPIAVPPQAAAGSTLPLRVKALFLVCSDEMCVPDELDLSLDLAVAEGPAELNPVHGPAIARILEQAPRPAGISARATLTNGVLTLTATGGPLGDRDPGPSYFFPFEPGIIDHAAPQSGSWGPQGLTLAITAGGAVRSAGLSGPIRGVLATRLGAFEIEAQEGAPLPGATGSGDLEPLAEGGSAPGAAGTPVVGVWSFVQAAAFAFLGGLILNLMPCVFPVLAMKAAALASSAGEPRRARLEGLAFLAGVLATFLALAGALLALRSAGEAIGWGFQLQSPGVTAALALLMAAVALNLSGVFHVGGGLQGLGSGPLSRLPGGAAAFLTGVLAVVVAAPCTAPFMAFALGAALVMPWPLALCVFLMLGLGLALPFVAVSVTPGALRRLPRPGAWMERLKGLLAFPMYAAALWLAWVFGRQAGDDALGLLFAAGLLLALGLWLLGRGQSDRAIGRPARAVFAAGFLALAGSSAAAVTGVAAARPPEAGVGAPGDAGAEGLAGSAWSPQAVQAALADGRPVLVNFTADWCVTCKINERTSLSSPRVAEALREADALYLVGDWTRRDPAIAAELESHGRSGVPLYLLYEPGAPEPRLLPQLLSEGLVIEALKEVSSDP